MSNKRQTTGEGHGANTVGGSDNGDGQNLLAATLDNPVLRSNVEGLQLYGGGRSRHKQGRIARNQTDRQLLTVPK